MSDIHLIKDTVPTRRNTNNNIRTMVIQNMAKKLGKDVHEIEHSLNHQSNFGLTEPEIEERKKYRVEYKKEYNRLLHKATYKKNSEKIKQAHRDRYNKDIEKSRNYIKSKREQNKAFKESINSLINSDFFDDEEEEPYTMMEETPDISNADADIFLEDIDFEVLDDITPNIRKGGKRRTRKGKTRKGKTRKSKKDSKTYIIQRRI
jgi:hypothetical protein